MKFITISIYISLCILFVGCKKTNSSTNEMCNCSVESIEDEEMMNYFDLYRLNTR